jgi:hypothetical protein
VELHGRTVLFCKIAVLLDVEIYWRYVTSNAPAEVFAAEL